MSNKYPFVLAIMDGWGVASPWGGNATTLAKTPTISRFWQTAPRAILGAAEESVGLPKGERGNSEVGHLNIGCGRIVHQDLSSISASIDDGSFFQNEILVNACKTVQKREATLHLIGLLSDGGVHSHISHLFALLDMAQKQGVKKVLIHIFTDGRDSAPMQALSYIERLEAKLKKLKFIRIATVAGRYFGMDREQKWDRTEKVYRLLTEGIGEQAKSTSAAITQSYRVSKSDEFITPTVIRGEDQMTEFIKDNDVIILFNFRADRARQITDALINPNFKAFDRVVVRKNLLLVTFTSYQEGLPVEVAFSPEAIVNSLAEVLSQEGKKQFHIAETAKYPHVTYFFNGGKEKAFPGEDRVMIPSPKVATYDQRPEMSAREVTDKIIARLSDHEFHVVNFANCDMVGHTGLIKAAVKAVQCVDQCIGRLWKEVMVSGGDMIVTADHGNIEQMVNPATGQPDTEHTTNPVPFFFLTSKSQLRIKKMGILADTAPTILDWLGLTIPKEMDGESLIVKEINKSSD